MHSNEIEKLENEIYEANKKLAQLRKENPGSEVKNYTFQTLEGEVTLKDLFAGRDKLFVIHNMGKGCRYCTIWADGINSFLPHLEDKYSVVLVSKNTPEEQRRMANDRGWRFRMASHGGGEYIQEQSVSCDYDAPSAGNYPGIVCYTKNGDKILKKNASPFGPGDEFCSIWNILSLAGVDEETWTPQFRYWNRPEKMDDGGANLEN